MDRNTGLTSMIQDAVDAGQLDRDLDVAQLIFELRGIVLAFHEALHVMRSNHARSRANRAITALMERHAPAAPARPVRGKAR